MSIYRAGILGLLICSPVFLSASEDGARQPIRFAPSPMEGSNILHEQFFGLVGYLQRVLDRPVVMVDSDDDGELLLAFHGSDVDLAYLSSLPYALLAQTDAEVEPVVYFREADGLSQTTSSWVAIGGHGIDMAVTQWLHIGLTQPLSSCGYFAVSLEELPALPRLAP